MTAKPIVHKPWLAGVLIVGLSSFSVYGIAKHVQLKPEVSENFFFASDDPQFMEDRKISELFPQPPQLIIGAKGDVRSPLYAEKVDTLTRAIGRLSEVFGVQSLTAGPNSFSDVLKGPLWRRVLMAEDWDATFIHVFVRDVPPEVIVEKLKKLILFYDEPGFELIASGPPYVMELIRLYLLRDFKVFSLVVVLVFSVVIYLVFHSVRLLLGTLVTCGNASALTLISAHFLDIPIGPLTANLSTIVFVLTLSHIVFLTFNAKELHKADGKSDVQCTIDAARMTFEASFWSAFTTLLGFLSLLLVSATPLKQLGIAGAIGTIISFLTAYGVYPWFLCAATIPESEIGSHKLDQTLGAFFVKRHFLLALLCFAAAAFYVSGVRWIDTDPNLFSYFKEGNELREGLEYIDRNGGSSPLKFVVTTPENEPFNSNALLERLWTLHQAFEGDPDVGQAVSLPLIIQEAKRQPLTVLFTLERLIQMLESERFAEVARYFITDSREEALFVLRMKESSRTTKRPEVVERLETIIRAHGFVPHLTGGVYFLQGALAKVLATSLVSGLAILLALFILIGLWLTRSIRVTLALIASLGLIPVCLLGAAGFMRIPLDVISAPSVNIAIAMGVDAMIHIVLRARRESRARKPAWPYWATALSHLWKPILASAFVISTGFGIFGLSIFPPTQRFGFSVVHGALITPVAALIVLPFFAGFGVPGQTKTRRA